MIKLYKYSLEIRIGKKGRNPIFYLFASLSENPRFRFSLAGKTVAQILLWPGTGLSYKMFNLPGDFIVYNTSGKFVRFGHRGHFTASSCGKCRKCKAGWVNPHYVETSI